MNIGEDDKCVTHANTKEASCATQVDNRDDGSATHMDTHVDVDHGQSDDDDHDFGETHELLFQRSLSCPAGNLTKSSDIN